jgi:hypothetical protein
LPARVAQAFSSPDCVRAGGDVLCHERGTFVRKDLGAAASDLSCNGIGGCCAALSDGTVRCFGNNDRGVLGDGSPLWSAAPVRVANVGKAVSLALGQAYTLALTSEGDVFAWGGVGERGFPQRIAVPGKVVEIAGAEGAAVARLAGGEIVVVVPDPDGWQQQRFPDVGAPVTALATYDHGVCAIVAGGDVRCLFRGEGDAFASVAGVSDAVALSGGGSSLCLLRRAGTVACLLDRRYDEHKYEATGPVPSPVAVTGLSGVRRLAIPYAELASGNVVEFGIDESDRWRITPRADLAGIERLSAGGFMWSPSCGIAHGRATCWGSPSNGVLGRSGEGVRLAPGPVQGDFPVTSVVAGSYHACAIHTDGGVLCWGNDKYGALGRGRVIRRTKPIRVARLGPS